MKKTHFIAMFWILASTQAAYGSQFKMTEYECSQINVERDGFACKIIDGDTLFMKIYMRPDAPKEALDRSRYLYVTTQHNFMAAGGRHIKIRNSHWKKNDAGLEKEKSCLNYKLSGKLVCDEYWYPAKD